MRALFLTKYTEQGASSRYRTFQHLPGLEHAGIECTVSPLFDERYLAARYGRGRRPLGSLLAAGLRRLSAALAARRHDLTVVEKELLPFTPALLERGLLRARRYTLDFDDAQFHRYDQHRSGLVRALLGGKLARIVRGAALVTAANGYLEERLRAHASRLERLPTVLDPAKYPDTPEPEGELTIGWIGTPVSSEHLALVAQPLARLFAKRPGRLLAIGAGADFALPGVRVENAAWSGPAEAGLLARAHVGIMPLADRPFERGKSGLKLLQFLASGRPVIASPVGVNAEIVGPEVGFLAGDDAEWDRALETLAGDRGLRAALGDAGRTLVRERYALGDWTPRYAAWLRAATRAVR